MTALTFDSGDVPIDLSGTSPNAASTVAVTPVIGFGKFDAIKIEAELQGATGGTLDVYIQVSHDWHPILQTGKFVDYVHFTQLAAAASPIIYNVDPALTNSITVIGKNLVPALAAGTVAGGYWGDAMRLLFVAGASTSAGALQTVTVIGKRRMRP